ncbi:MAG: Lrp/AsnC ligand binding domain-containing protein [Candidatus Lokiarchaeota archaeon]|nr:Lrp/AsnC ligand binding domain-containing protein [Candidatus Lokiarchaeota archaeon]
MLKAFIMVSLTPNSIAKFTEAVRKLPFVKRILSLTGEWDVCVEFEGETADDLYRLHAEMDGLIGLIENTVTSVVMKEFEP